MKPRQFSSFLFFVIFSSAASAGIINGGNEKTNRNESNFLLGLDVGYGAPYGLGLELGYLVNSQIDLNLGLGYNLSGKKIGIGSRYQLARFGHNVLFCGANFIDSSGSQIIISTSEGGTLKGAYYEIPATGVIHLRLGMLFGYGRVASFATNVGYGYPLSGAKPKYLSGTTSTELEKIAQRAAAGGIEVSGALIFWF